MPKQIIFDTGINEYEINNGKSTIRFNPTDPALFARILNFQDELAAYQKKYSDFTQNLTGEVDENGFPVGTKESLEQVQKLDSDIKKGLQDIFGKENDFDAIFEYGSSMALTNSGDLLINNFLVAIAPLIEGDSEQRMAISKKVEAARKKTQGNRQQRRTSQRK